MGHTKRKYTYVFKQMKWGLAEIKIKIYLYWFSLKLKVHK